MDELLLRRRMLNMFRDEYIVFADPNVEQICATNWGDGTKITKNQAAAVTSLGNKFQGNTTIMSFDELSYFKNLRTLQNSEFNGCTSLTSISIPDSVTSIGTYAFSNTAFTEFERSVTCNYGNYCFQASSLQRIKIKTTNASGLWFAGCGSKSNRCNIIIDGNLTSGSVQSDIGGVRKLVVFGNITSSISNYWGNGASQLRIGGNCSGSSSLGLWYGAGSALVFFEVLGDVTSTGIIFYLNKNNRIIHLGHKGVITANPASTRLYNCGKIYVGPGESKSEDEEILAQYMADSKWASYTSKLATWWSYKTSDSANQDYLIPMSEL